MPNFPKWPSSYLLFFLLVLSGSTVVADEYDDCKRDIERIWNENETLRGFNRESLWHFFYTGPIERFDGTVPRFPPQGNITMPEGNITDGMYMPFTYEGCKLVCGNPIVLNKLDIGLSISATWIFPLAILLSLPYESLHKKRKRKTLAALSNWLGSPQTSLTASVWNFRQTKRCRQVIKAGNSKPEWKDAFYVLSCFNQFDLRSWENQVGQKVEEDQRRLLRTLVYGLFRPISCAQPDPNFGPGREILEKALIKELLSTLAFQLRKLRRRGVIPTIASLMTFLLAFIFSVILAFADLKESTSVFILDLALLFSWLPVLVIFTIVDRNPVSSERQAELMSRWLYTVDAIWEWSEPLGQQPQLAPQQIQPAPQLQQTTQAQQIQPTSQPEALNISWWSPTINDLGCFKVGDFIGQGRRMEYCGLTEAVVTCTNPEISNGRPFVNWTRDKPRELAKKISTRLDRRRLPTSWSLTAAVCLVIVLADTLMAFMSDFITPPVGLGCWSFSVMMYAITSSVSWFLQFWKHPPTWLRVISHVFNTLAILCLVGTIAAVLTGIYNNCYCRSTMPGFRVQERNAFMDFETFRFYKAHFNLIIPWGVATAIGSLLQVGALVSGLWWWHDCQIMWEAQGSGFAGEQELTRRDMNWAWLRE